MERKRKIFFKKFCRYSILWAICKYPILSQISAEFWCYMLIVCCVYLRIHQYDLFDVSCEIIVIKADEYLKKAIEYIQNIFKK
jgi:hypothetical protein